MKWVIKVTLFCQEPRIRLCRRQSFICCSVCRLEHLHRWLLMILVIILWFECHIATQHKLDWSLTSSLHYIHQSIEIRCNRLPRNIARDGGGTENWKRICFLELTCISHKDQFFIWCMQKSTLCFLLMISDSI